MRDVIVLGAGPAGLATTAELRRARVDVELFDRTGDVGGAYARMDPAIVMTSPASLVALPHSRRLGGEYATAAAYRDYLIDYAREHAIAPTRADVTSVARESVAGAPRSGTPESRPDERAEDDRRRGRSSGREARERDHYCVTADGVEHRARTVVIATGSFHQPYIPAFPGTPAVPVEHAAAWRTGRAARGERVLIVGGASSAIEIAEDVARSGGVATIACRKILIGRATWFGVDPGRLLFPLFSHVSPRRFCAGEVTVPGVDRGFRAFVARGAITERDAPTRIDGHRVELARGAPVEVDRVVLATGYRWLAPFLPVDVARNERGVPRCRANQSVSHPGLYVVGAPCARSAASQYLYGISRDATAVAAEIARG